MADPATQFQSAGLQVPYNYIPQITHLNPPMHLSPVDYSSIGLALRDLPQTLMNSPLNPAVRESIRLSAQGSIQGQKQLAAQSEPDPTTGVRPRDWLGHVEGGTYITQPATAAPQSVRILMQPKLTTPQDQDGQQPEAPATEPQKPVLEEKQPPSAAPTPSNQLKRTRPGDPGAGGLGPQTNSMGQRLTDPRDMFASTPNPNAPPPAPDLDYVQALARYKVPSQGGSTAGLSASTAPGPIPPTPTPEQVQQEQQALQQWQNQQQGSAASAQSALDWARSTRDTAIDRAVYMDHGGPGGSPAFAFYSGKKSAPNIVPLSQMVKSGFAPDVLAQNTSQALGVSHALTGSGSLSASASGPGPQGPAAPPTTSSAPPTIAPVPTQPQAQPPAAPPTTESAPPTMAPPQTGAPSAPEAAPVVDEDGQPVQEVGPPSVMQGSLADQAAKRMVATVQQLARVPRMGGIPPEYLSAQAARTPGVPGAPPVDSNGIPRTGLNNGTLNHSNTDGLSQYTNGRYNWDMVKPVYTQAFSNRNRSLYPPRQNGDLRISNAFGMPLYMAMGPDGQAWGAYFVRPGQDLFSEDRLWYMTDNWMPYDLPEQQLKKNLHELDKTIPMEELVRMPDAEVERRLREFAYKATHSPIPGDVQGSIDQSRDQLYKAQRLLNGLRKLGSPLNYTQGKLEKSERGREYNRLDIGGASALADIIPLIDQKIDQGLKSGDREVPLLTKVKELWLDLARGLPGGKDTSVQSHAEIDRQIGNIWSGATSGTVLNALQSFIKTRKMDMHRSIDGALNQWQMVKPMDFYDNQRLMEDKQIYDPSDPFQEDDDTVTPPITKRRQLSPEGLQANMIAERSMQRPTLAQVMTQRDYETLPRGARYIDSQGTIGVKLS